MTTTAQSFIPSQKQIDFFHFVAHGHGSCNLISVAGSGKSTSILRSFPYIPEHKSILYLVFNTRNSNDMKAKLADLRQETGRAFEKVFIKTFHAHGFGILVQHLKSRGVTLQKPTQYKCRELFKTMVSANNFILYSSFVTKLVSYAKGEGIGLLTPSTPEAYYNIIEHHDMQLDHNDATFEQAITYTRELMSLSFKAARDDGNIDFDDMLFMPVALNLNFYPQDYIFCDEAQDTNPMRREILRRCCRTNGLTRVFAVGDPKQAIYGFTGATNDAMDLIKKEFNSVELYLNVSYRCSKAVLPEVQGIVPYFEVHPNNNEGDVFDVNLEEALPILTARDAILCRNVAPLVSLAFKLISRGRACHVLGSEIGQGLISLVKKMGSTDLADLTDKLTAWRDREMNIALSKDQEQKAANINDRAECIFTLMDSLPENYRTVSALLCRIDSLFKDDEPTLCLSSMHKSKGGEWDNVVIYREELMPSPWARQSWQREQESNLEYVAKTRTMNYLMYMGEVK